MKAIHIISLAISITGLGAYAGPLETFVDCDGCPEMVVLPTGKFMMGALPNEVRRRVMFEPINTEIYQIDDEWFSLREELPRHEVEVDIKIAIGKNEVTYNQWINCVNDGVCNSYVPPRLMYVNDGPKISGNHPVTCVSFNDAMSYIDWINERLGTSAYRLPTGAEWEYAARAGTTTRFAQGDNLTSKQANFSGNKTAFLLQEKKPDLLTLGKPVPVEELVAENQWGIRHMSGNVSEATLSCYTSGYEGWENTSMWLAQSDQGCDERVFRGGNFRTSVLSLRSAAKSNVGVSTRLSMFGFRIVKVL